MNTKLNQQIIEEYKKIISLIHNSNIDYCLIRNFYPFIETHTNQYPKMFTNEDIVIKDLDILISSKDNHAVVNLLLKNGFIQTFTGPIPGHLVFVKYNNLINKFIHLDLHVGGLTHDGILYFPESLILNNKLLINNIYITNSDQYISGLILHSIFDKKYFKPEYQTDITNYIKTANASFYSVMNTLIPYTLIPEITSDIQKEEYSKILKYRLKLIFYFSFKYPSGMMNFLTINLSRACKVLNPFWKGALISFIGPDGSGKTSSSDEIQKILQSGGFRVRKVYMGWRGSIIPFISKLMTTDKKVFRVDQNKPQQIDNSMLKIFRSILITKLYIFEMSLRYIFLIFPYRKLGYIILTDRYVYDRIALDRNLPAIIKKAIHWFFPKPTLCLYFSAEPEVLAQRESNLSLANLENQFAGFEKIQKDIMAVKFATDVQNQNSILQAIMRIIEKVL